MAALEIVCDESGYEGEKLIDTTTDVFAHAGVRLDPAAARDSLAELRRRVRSPATQYKANHLQREKHRAVLVWFLGPAGPLAGRSRGTLVSMENGSVVAFALFSLSERSTLFVAPGAPVYEGMIVGENSRADDMDVNPTKEKKLTNMRSKSSDENIQLEPPRELTLEGALEYIEDDELIEVTPQSIRLRKRFLSANDRKKLSREAKRERARVSS